MPVNQTQYHQPQQQQQQAPPQQQSTTIYATQMPQASYGSNQVCASSNLSHVVQRFSDLLYLLLPQNVSQYNQPIYVSSNSNQNLNQQQLTNAPIQNQNGPIYVSSNVASQSGMMMPNYSAANNTHNAPQEQGTG